jgi:hypothetical protein
VDQRRALSILLVSRHLPEPQGTAAGRVLLATGTGLLADGHRLRVVSWGPRPPAGPLPDWCEWRPVPAGGWAAHVRALTRPRRGSADLRLEHDGVDLVLADDPVSFAAVEQLQPAAVTVHYSTALDVAALRRLRPAQLQDIRGERYATSRAAAVLAYSSRVATRLGGTAVPMPFAVPERTLPPVAEPVVGLLADMRWPPNRAAVRTLLRAWPAVRRRVPGARLVLAGRGLPVAAERDGVQLLGWVGDSEEVLGRLAVLAFPCPRTSGPKVKVLEAMAAGVAVATSPAGVEGLDLPPTAAFVGTDAVATVVAALTAPMDRAGRARGARPPPAAVVRAHSPVPAARAKLAALQPLLAG